MHKDIFAAPIWGNEAKTLVGVVPLHRPNLLNRGPVGRGMVCGSLWSGTPRLLLGRGARIHAEDLRHLRPLRARAGTHLERRAGRHAAVATALNYAHMEECIAGTIGQHKPAATLLEGRTVVPNRECALSLAGVQQVVVEKQSVDVFEAFNLRRVLDALAADCFVVYGVVTEICVWHAARGLLALHKPVTVVTDAVKELAPDRAASVFEQIRASGGTIATLAGVCRD